MPIQRTIQLKEQNKTYDLAVVIPVYNESGCIEKVLSEWRQALLFQKIKFKIVVINDGSTDNTSEILEKFSNQYQEIIYFNQRNGGHGNALLNGYHQGLKLNPDYIFQVDSDDQFLPQDFIKLWKKRSGGAFISGIRRKRKDPLHRLLISKFLKFSLKAIFGVHIADANIPFRLIKADFLKSVLHNLPPNIFAPNIFLAVLAAKSLGGYTQIPVTHIERQTGTVSIVKLNLIKACFRSLKELIQFATVLEHKVSRIKIEQDQEFKLPDKRHAS